MYFYLKKNKVYLDLNKKYLINLAAKKSPLADSIMSRLRVMLSEIRIVKR